MKRTLTPAERLIVAADFKPTHPDGRKWVREQVIALAKSLRGTGVYIKVNSALRVCGYDLIDEIHSYNLRVFADLKLYDIGETLSTDAFLLHEFKPELLTTVCSIGVKSLTALKAAIPDTTEVLGVTVLTSLGEGDVKAIHGGLTLAETAAILAEIALESCLGGLIASPKELCMLRVIAGGKMTINTPGIRPVWAIVPGDDQNPDRIATPAKAIKAGADRIVVGRPIVLAQNPYDAVMRTIEEIDSAMG